MVSQKERARLIATSGGKDPLYAAGTVIKCAVCLLFLCGLALIGAASGPLTADGAADAISSGPNHPRQGTRYRASNAHRVRTANQNSRPSTRAYRDASRRVREVVPGAC